MKPPTEATIEDLYRLPENGKAEVVNGELVLMSPTGDDPGYAGDEIFVSLRAYAKSTRNGRAVGDNKGFLVDLQNRVSFSPDAASTLAHLLVCGSLKVPRSLQLKLEVRETTD